MRNFCWLRLVSLFRTVQWAELEQEITILNFTKEAAYINNLG